MHTLFALPTRIENWATHVGQFSSSTFVLGLRLYVAKVFLASGLTKIADLDSTIALFENEYRVPVLSPALAAYSGTAAELILPALFALGLMSRSSAFAFFLFNAVAVMSYPDISEAGIKDHIVWGTMIATVFFFGAGKWSIDQWWKSRSGLVKAWDRV